VASYRTYGAKRVYAELTLSRGIEVGHNAVAMLMSRAGIAGHTGAPKWKGSGAPTAEDLVPPVPTLPAQRAAADRHHRASDP